MDMVKSQTIQNKLFKEIWRNPSSSPSGTPLTAPIKAIKAKQATRQGIIFYDSASTVFSLEHMTVICIVMVITNCCKMTNIRTEVPNVTFTIIVDFFPT